ncbi:hypothetical protein SVAN01_03123 [Stagonosporopsis vannaccii]|nr:hypothetical protein SVAN01_03123 [Stagonosporopsis vannaccii]
MLVCTLAHIFLLASSVAAQPQISALDMVSIDDGSNKLPAPALQRTSSKALSSVTAAQSTFSSATTSAPHVLVDTKSSFTVPVNRTTCLPTTTLVVILPNPTPTPDSGAPRSEGGFPLSDDEQHGAGAPLDTAAPEAVSRWPHWFTAGTFALVFYDILALGALLWVWAFGYLWWFRRGSQARYNTVTGTEGHIEMARLDIERVETGRREITREWVRTGRGNGGIRREAWERVRRAREVELERELIRLGMI